MLFGRVIFCLIIAIRTIKGQSGKEYYNATIRKYDEIRTMFPKVSQVEAKNWRMSANDDTSVHPCRRECKEDDVMTCYYYFVVHYDETQGPSCQRYFSNKFSFKVQGKGFLDTLAIQDVNGYDDCKYGDGVPSELMVVNGQFPGQSIDVCRGDTVVVDVINSMQEPTTIHWHGLHMQVTPHMDGVPHVTQYPIEAGQAFRYRFEVDKVGTNWWHSHYEHQRGFGLAGAFIVRQPSFKNPHAKLYDYDHTEHVLLIQDCTYHFDENIPKNILINGLGRNSNMTLSSNPTMYATFNVIRGGRYRFRVIFNGVANCPVSFSIDDHDLVVIATDGNDIEPVTVQKLVFTGAERFDFVLHANQEVANYWVRVKGYSFCQIDKLHQEAILHYKGADRKAFNTRSLSYQYEADGIEINSLNHAPNGDKTRIAMPELTALDKSTGGTMKPAETHYVSMAVNVRGGFLFQMNDITFTMPRISLLQTRNLGIESYFCNKTQMVAKGFNCRTRHCKCTNVVHLPAFQNVEMIFYAETNSAHPIHIHGFTFRVVGMGVLGEDQIKQIEEIDRRNPLPRRTQGGPWKDSVQVPAFGYTIVRFQTNNPGYWIAHCHISTHSENGMAIVLKVGEPFQMKMCPVSNCGLCSSAL